MAERTLIGARIRDRRIAQGRRQGDLARAVGISPSYLNLIEHNRRRIGGKLLSNIALELGTEVGTLTQERNTALVNALRAGLTRLAKNGEAPGQAAPEADRVEEFCARFPGWAGGVARVLSRNERLERVVGALSDRMAHDPHLSAALHEVLSRVTAIHSTSSILTDSDDLDRNWHKRFQKNLHEDAEKLSGSVQALVEYFDQAGTQDRGLTSPQEELEHYLAEREYHLAAVETGGSPDDISMNSADASEQAAAYFRLYASDAEALPLAELEQAVDRHGEEPFAIAHSANLPVHVVMRRLATMPGREIGRVSCDGSGALLFRKPIPGFEIPRLGAACSLWPLFDALHSPARPVVAKIVQDGRDGRSFRAIAYADAMFPGGSTGPVLYRAEMLVFPAERAENDRLVGSNCRICSLADCPARREVSLLGEIGR